MTTSRPHARRTPPTHGFTLTEVLLAAALAAGLITLIVNQLTGLARQNTDRATEARATATVNTVIQAINKDFERGTFAAFQTGTRTRYVAVFTTGTPVTLPKQAANLHTLTTIRAPRLNANVGDQLLLIAANGTAKLTTITAQANPDDYTLNCPTGLPSTGRVTAYRAFTSGIDATGTRLKHITPTTEEDLGPNSDVRFDYVYQAADGTLVKTPPGAPANATPAGPLVGFIPGAQQDQTAERRTMIPTTPRTLRRIIACQEMGLTTVNEGRLNVTILGLPDGQAANVTLHGPDPAVNGQHPTASTAYTPVQPGTYTIEAQPITIGKVTYLPEIGGSPATLYNTWGDTFLQVKYVKQTGQLNLTVTGLPPGSTGTVHVRGPEDRDLSLSNGTSNLELATGAYTVTADKSGSATPTVTPESFTVSTGASQTVNVTYPGVVPPTSGNGLLRLNIWFNSATTSPRLMFDGHMYPSPAGWRNLTTKVCSPARNGPTGTYNPLNCSPYTDGNITPANNNFLRLSRVDGQPFEAPSALTYPTASQYTAGSWEYYNLVLKASSYDAAPVSLVKEVRIQRGDMLAQLNLPAGEYQITAPNMDSQVSDLTLVEGALDPENAEGGILVHYLETVGLTTSVRAVPAASVIRFTIKDATTTDIDLPYTALYTAQQTAWNGIIDRVQYNPMRATMQGMIQCLIGPAGACLPANDPAAASTQCALTKQGVTMCSPDTINSTYPSGLDGYCRVNPDQPVKPGLLSDGGLVEDVDPSTPITSAFNCLPKSSPSNCFIAKPAFTTIGGVSVTERLRVYCGPEDVSKYGF